MTRVGHVRPIQFVAPGESVENDLQQGDTTVVAQLETASFLARMLPPRSAGQSLHYHDVDQLLFVFKGSLGVQLGAEVDIAAAGSFVFAPAGIAHWCWNPGTEPVQYVEVFVPTPALFGPSIHFVSSPERAPGSAHRGFVKRASAAMAQDFGEGSAFDLSPFLGFGCPDNADTCMSYHAMVPPGGGGPPLHTHPFDQFYLVIEGQLNVQIGLAEHLVLAPALVALPAGVPHRQWNRGPGAERHVVVNTPIPAQDNKEWDVPVALVANGDPIGPRW